MTRAIPTLAGLVTAISLAFAAPAATAPGPAYDACGLEYEYVYAGAQCGDKSGSIVLLSLQRAASPATSTPATSAPSTSAPPAVNQTCPGEYEYIYPGAQCAVTSGS